MNIENNFNINLLNEDKIELQISAEVDSADKLLIKQKIKLIYNKIFDSLNEEEKDQIHYVNFIYKEKTKKMTIFLGREEGKVRFNLQELEKEARKEVKLRSKEIIHIIQDSSSSAIDETVAKYEGGHTHIRSLSARVNIVTQLFRYIQRWYCTYFVIAPAIKDFVTSHFSNSPDTDTLLEKWKTSELPIRDFVDVLYQELNIDSGRHYELFSFDEITKMVKFKALLHYSSRFQHLTGNRVSDVEKSRLELIPVMHQVAIEFEDGPDSKEAKKQWSERIDSVPAIHLPLEELAAIPITANSESSLLKTWTRALKDLRKEGLLDELRQHCDPVTLLKQNRYAYDYLTAIQLLPATFKEIIRPSESHTREIEIFLEAQPNAVDLFLPSTESVEKKEIFQKQIRPIIDESISKLKKDNQDFIAISEILIGNNAGFVDTLLEKINNELNQNQILDEKRDSLGLTNEKLVDYIYFSLEELGMEDYYISGKQIANLRAGRKELVEEKKIQHEKIEREIENFHKKLMKYEKEFRKAKTEEKQTELKKRMSRFVKELIALPVVEMAPLLLKEIPISEANHEIMGDVWETIISAIHQMAQESKNSLEKKRAELDYLIIKNTFAALEDPSSFKHRVAAKFEYFDKVDLLTKEILYDFKNFDQCVQESDRRGLVSNDVKEAKAQLMETLARLDPEKIRYEELSKMKITKENAKYVQKMWKNIISKVIREGSVLQINGLKNFDKISNRNKFQSHLLEFASLKLAIENIKDLNVKKSCKALVDRIDDEKLNLCLNRRLDDLEDEKSHVVPLGIELLLQEVTVTEIPALTAAQKTEELTHEEVQNLCLLTKALASKESRQDLFLSEKEKAQLDDFIKFSSRPSKESRLLNQKLKKMLDDDLSGKNEIRERLNMTVSDDRLYKKIPYGISREAVDMIASVTYKIKSAKEREGLVVKLESLVNKIKDRETITEKDKLTRKELGIIFKCSKLGKGENSLLKKLQGIEISLFNDYDRISMRATQLLEELDRLFQSQTKLRDGDFLVHVGRQEFDFLSHQANFVENLQLHLITPYTHAAKVFREGDKRMISHIYKNYVQQEISFIEASYSQVWRLDAAALIPKKNIPLFEKLYGEDWKQDVQAQYENFERQIHQNKNDQFDEIQNSKDRRFEAGKADYIWKGHKNEFTRDFQELAERILGTNPELNEKKKMKTMICSEFASRTTAAALVLLNDFFSETIGEYLLNSGDEEKGRLVKEQRDILELPYDQKEKLRAIHPTRMIELLKNKNCIKFVPPTYILQQVVKNLD